jgi:hypothetical protein
MLIPMHVRPSGRFEWMGDLVSGIVYLAYIGTPACLTSWSNCQNELCASDLLQPTLHWNPCFDDEAGSMQSLMFVLAI